jgi:hypothetical protein
VQHYNNRPWFAVHSAYSFEELGNCVKKAYGDIQHFQVLESFANFRDAVKPLLNTAAGTPGIIIQLLVTLVFNNSWAIQKKQMTSPVHNTNLFQVLPILTSLDSFTFTKME